MMKILFAGGDARTLAAIEYMKKQGYTPISYKVSDRTVPDISGVEALILPYPALKNGKLNAPMTDSPPTVAELIGETGIDPGTLPAIGGPFPENPFVHYTDLSRSEELKLRNAVTTAEGALALLIKNTERAIFGMKVLILGYGAIGKRLSALLQAMGARVTVAARKEKDRIDAEHHGYTAQDTEQLSLNGQKAVFNTVPVRLMTREILRNSDADTCFFELASAPGGCDPNDVKALGRTWIPGPALPGKVAPVTAGEDLAKTLIHILSSQKRKGSGTNSGT